MDMWKLAIYVGRALIGLLFILGGVGKITGYAATQTYMAAYGVPGVLLPAVIVLELGGGIALVTGFYARHAAAALAAFCIVAAIIFHHEFGDRTQLTFFLKDFAIAGGLLLLAIDAVQGRASTVGKA